MKTRKNSIFSIFFGMIFLFGGVNANQTPKNGIVKMASERISLLKKKLVDWSKKYPKRYYWHRSLDFITITSFLNYIAFLKLLPDYKKTINFIGSIGLISFVVMGLVDDDWQAVLDEIVLEEKKDINKDTNEK